MHRALLMCALPAIAVLMVVNLSGVVGLSQRDSKTSVPEAEAKAVNAVEAAPDLAAKLAAAEVFVKKYPQSIKRQQVVDYLVDQIGAIKDGKERLNAAQKFQTMFTADAELNAIKPVVIEANISAEQFDDAFANGASHLAKNPDDVRVLSDLAITATEQAKQKNAKYALQGAQYGAKAIELIEADKKPATMAAEVWGRHKAMLPQLYQEMAIISIMQQDDAGARGRLEKAIKLNPADPLNYGLLGDITNTEYQKIAKTYQEAPPGKTKDDALQQATGLIDKMIDLYAHAVALSEGKALYEQLHDQMLKDLSSYYKYRHNNSTDGMQKLIDGYKLPANP